MNDLTDHPSDLTRRAHAAVVAIVSDDAGRWRLLGTTPDGAVVQEGPLSAADAGARLQDVLPELFADPRRWSSSGPA